MTQTLIPTVENARNELGGTLADALRFVEGTTCTECGTEASETSEHAAFPLRCQDCNVPGCRCVLIEDPHCADVFFCADCLPPCGCRSCMD
jgi:hypothetical protein